ncbi:MAG TPA: hypothetical protein EYG73_05055 [Arcobacter sp.]|nr:hypothetical protein [Arcobacter sp.]
MRYSFTRPKPKQFMDSDTKIILVFLTVTILLTVGFVIFIMLKKGNFESDTLAMQKNIAKYRKENRIYKKEIKRIERLAQKFEAIQTKNTLLKESIQNLFDLVPDQITLTKAILNKNGLVLYGVTPSKDVYNYLLQAPLRSVFHRNDTTFYPLKNGWYRFVSINEGGIETGNGVDE